MESFNWSASAAGTELQKCIIPGKPLKVYHKGIEAPADGDSNASRSRTALIAITASCSFELGPDVQW